MAAEPYSLTASLTLPPDTGQPNETLSYSFAGTFLNAVQQTLVLEGAGAHLVDFGTAQRPKIFWLEFEPGASNTPPINVVINGGPGIPVTAGGFLAYSSPTAGNVAPSLSSITINFSSACTLRIALLA